MALSSLTREMRAHCPVAKRGKKTKSKEIFPTFTRTHIHAQRGASTHIGTPPKSKQKKTRAAALPSGPLPFTARPKGLEKKTRNHKTSTLDEYQHRCTTRL